MNVGILDYHAGNLTSVVAAVRHLGYSYKLVTEPKQIHQIDKLIVPGVGEARSAMDYLTASGLGQTIKDFVHWGKPCLGICLGSQIILDSSEERDTTTLGLIPGVCTSLLLEHRNHNIPARSLKIPHIGWNQVYGVPSQGPGALLFSGIPEGRSFYFDHSFVNRPSNPDHIFGVANHGVEFAAALGKDNLVAVQFHPEKSGTYGLRLLSNFLSEAFTC